MSWGVVAPPGAVTQSCYRKVRPTCEAQQTLAARGRRNALLTEISRGAVQSSRACIQRRSLLRKGSCRRLVLSTGLAADRGAAPNDSQTARSGVAAVKQVLQGEGGRLPYITDPEMLSEEVTYVTDLWECRGRDEYVEASNLALKRQGLQLYGVQYDVLKVAEVGPGELLVRWSISWVPTVMERFVELGKVWPGMQIEYTDLLDRLEVETKFTWKALGAFLGRAVLQGKLRVPLAVILGSTKINVADGDGGGSPKITRISESWDIVSLVAAGRLRNRRAGRDLACLMDTVRPPSMPFEEYEERVMAKVDMSDVPGMSPMDIDGVDGAAIDNISTVISFLTIVVLTGGAAAAFVVYTKILEKSGDLPGMF